MVAGESEALMSSTNSNKQKVCSHVNISGINITDLTDLELEWHGNSEFVTTLNAELILLARRLPRLRGIINSGRVTVDGTWTKWALQKKISSRIKVKKLSGADLIYTVSIDAVNKGKRVLLLGGNKEANLAAVKSLGELSGRSELISGYSPPLYPYPFPDFVQDDIQRRITNEKPDIIILGLGVPKQEYWADDNRLFLKTIGVSYVMFFGGAIDFAAGIYKRAPRILQNLGLESPIRFIQNPRRWRRELSKLSFVWLAITGQL